MNEMCQTCLTLYLYLLQRSFIISISSLWWTGLWMISETTSSPSDPIHENAPVDSSIRLWNELDVKDLQRRKKVFVGGSSSGGILHLSPWSPTPPPHLTPKSLLLPSPRHQLARLMKARGEDQGRLRSHNGLAGIRIREIPRASSIVEPKKVELASKTQPPKDIEGCDIRVYAYTDVRLIIMSP